MRYAVALGSVALVSLSGCLCGAARAQVNQQSNNNSGMTTGATTGGTSGTPFGNLRSGSGQSGQSRTPFGSATETGVLGGLSGNSLLGAAAVSSLFGQGQGNGGNVGGMQQGMGNNAMGGMTGMRGGMQRGSRTGTQGNRNRTSMMGRTGRAGSQAVMRTRLSIGFEPPPVSAGVVTSRVEAVLAAPEIQALGPITLTAAVTPQGTVAVLRGTVATPEDRLVAEKIALLEPDVWAVQNDLQVVPPSGAATPTGSATPLGAARAPGLLVPPPVGPATPLTQAEAAPDVAAPPDLESLPPETGPPLPPPPAPLP
jgi:hypothetical protein